MQILVTQLTVPIYPFQLKIQLSSQYHRCQTEKIELI